MKKPKNSAKSACFYGALILYLKYCVLQKIKHILFFLESPLEDESNIPQGLNIQHLLGVRNAQ